MHFPLCHVDFGANLWYTKNKYTSRGTANECITLSISCKGSRIARSQQSHKRDEPKGEDDRVLGRQQTGASALRIFEHFEERRIQIIGNVEYTYIEKMSDSEKKERYSRFMEFDIPCIIFCRDLQPDEIFMEEAREHGIPVLSTGRSTSSFMAELIYCLGEQLAPCITVHGVLVDVYGEGVMITGESGIGKSEAALELIRRGHRLVTDDVVEIRKINEHTLMGTSPEITRHFIELRGIGIIDVKTLYGVECVKENSR